MNSRFCFAIFLLGGGALAAVAAEPAEDLAQPKIIQTRDPIFPPSLEHRGYSSGEVHLAVKVDAAGKLEDVLAIAFTQKEFADEAVEAVKTWKFEPARIGGASVGYVRNVVIYFQIQGIRVIETDPLDEITRLRFLPSAYEQRFEYSACSLRDLDRIPVPRHVVAPADFPRNPSDSVVIEFYIDEQGRVRLPGVKVGANADFANAALDAVSQWRFDPPTRKGKPVLVLADQTFLAKADAATSSQSP
jgi:TonB family protein